MRKNELQKIFSDMPQLYTDRLILRRMTKRDAADMYEYSHLSEVTEYLLWHPHSSIDHTKTYLSYLEKDYRMGNFYDWGVTLRDSGKLIGTCGFTTIDTVNMCGEIGYVLNPSYWGNGIACEAVDAVMQFGFDLRLHRIEAKYIIGNERSRRVMEKCGMTFEGIRRSSMFVKGQYRDIGVCSILSHEFGALELKRRRESYAFQSGNL
ncbi:MAG: GNAT family N-acetyltransferase [Clostridia bacterium]|nr:GNAT family N-acetyltransferase [Clostridia bacterium]